MSNNAIKYILLITAIAFVGIVIAYIILQKKMGKGDTRRMQELRKGTKEKKFTSDVIYQRLYLIYDKIPFVKRYLIKLRRKIEIISIEDEYLTRRQASSVITKALLIIVPLTILIFLVTSGNSLLRVILIFFEVFLIETLMAGMVDKLDTKLLKQQVDFFAEIRHAYHEYNMVEEAIYQVSQNDELEISRQGEKIYEILISDDPETELEKYYDVAPNSYLKEFAGVSHLTREFGDRQDKDGASLYLKNLNNITQEMQIEILKRDKLDYVFQSLSMIAMVPVLFIQPLKNWAISNFSFTAQFYNGKLGLIVEILLLVLTMVCYILTRKVKDSGGIKDQYKDPNTVWQAKIYKKPFVKKIVDLVIPKKGTKEYRKVTQLMKESASKQKMETFYINRIGVCILCFVATIILFVETHKVSVDYVYTEPTSDYNIMGAMSEEDQKNAMEVTQQHNKILAKFKGKMGTTKEKIEEKVRELDFFAGANDAEISKNVDQIYNKLQIINSEYLKWFELLIAVLIAAAGYMGPKLMLIFQIILRKLEIENEVMQFQTIILMLMKIERVNVEIILEWLERYANIFKEQITKCLNNYEAGAWEALEELKNEVTSPQFIRIIESLQSAVEKIPIMAAFDELDNEREYHQEKRKEGNEKLISKKSLIGKVVGFAPMVLLFVGYLIGPLVIIGFQSMTQTFAQMSASI